MPRSFLHCLCLVTLLSSNLVKCTIIDDEEPRRTYPARRAIDGSRGRKYYIAEDLDDGSFDSFGSSAGQYDPFEEETDFSDIRNNIPGEPGVDYPSYTRLPQTGFLCESQFRGYYADEAAGCQVFHVCDGTFLVSSFLCPVGSIFSQKLLTCDWWSKVDCSMTRNYHAINRHSHVSETDDDDILRKAFEMASVRSAGERIPVETVTEQRKLDDRRNRVSNYGNSATIQRGINDLQTGPDNYPDYPDYPSRGVTSRYRTTSQQLQNRQRYQEDDYYSQEIEDESPKRNNNPEIRVHTIGEDRKNDRHGSFRNEFQPSYAPTVPTVTTTARSFYSPTIPTAFRSSTLAREPSRYDLEVESSDHLYTARGRSDETVKAATPPSVIVKHVVETKNISLPMLINSATEEKENIDENFEESESSDRKAVTLSDAGTNTTKIEASTEEIVTIDDRSSENVTETLSILTIDNENRNPAVFSYSRDEDNSTDDSPSSFASEDKKPVEFLQPPQKEEVHEFRIMVLAESSSTTPRSDKESHRREKSLKKNSTSSANENIEVSVSDITPPLLVNEKEIPESRIIRIIINKNETSSIDSTNSITPEIPTEKPAKVDAAISEQENAPELEKIADDSFNKTEEAVTVKESISTSTIVPSYNTTPNTISKFDDLRSIEINNLAVLVAANEESNFNDTSFSVETSSMISEEKEVEDHERSSRSEETLAKGEEIADSVNEASSPYQVTLTVDKDQELHPNGDVIRKLIAQQEVGDTVGAADYKNFEIVKSEQPGAAVDDREELITSSDAATNLKSDRRVLDGREGRRISDEKLDNFHTNGLQSMDYYRNIVALVNGPNAPRPFSLEPQRSVENVEIRTPSDLDDREVSTSSPFVTGTNRNEIVTVTTRAPSQTTRLSIVSSSQGPQLLEKSFSSSETQQDEDILEQLSGTFGERKTMNNKQKVIFELPHPQRSLDFKTGLPLHDDQKAVTSGDEVEEYSSMPEKSTEKLYAKTVVETEFIPSIGFSLNTEEEREEYMEAVMKGLLPDVRVTEKTESETEKSVES